MSDLNEYNNQETPVNTQEEEKTTGNIPETDISAEPLSTAEMGPEIVSGTEPVKKKHKALFAAVAAVVVLAGGSAAAYGFIPSVKNTVNMAVMSDDKYYHWVESENAEDTAEDISEIYQKIIDSAANESEFQLKADLNSEAISSLIESFQNGAGASGDFASDIKIPESISIDAASKIEEGNATVTYSLKADENALATLNGFIKDTILYYEVPELSKDYLSFNIDDITSLMALSGEYGPTNYNFDDILKNALNGKQFENYFTPDELEALLNKYTELVYSNIEDVKITKGDEYNTATANLDLGTLYSIASDFLDEAENDKTIIDFAVKQGYTEEQYTNAVKALQDQMGDLEVKGGKTVLTMKVFIDKSGNICGRSFTDPENTTEIKYLCKRDGHDIDLEFLISTVDFDFSVTGDLKEKSDKLNGTINVSVKDESTDTNFAVNIEDLESVGKNKEYLNGTISLDLSSLNAGVYSLKMDSDGNSQTISTDITVNGTNYAKLSLYTSKKVTSELPAFDSSKKTYDIINNTNAMEEYISNADLTGFMNKIGDAFGISDLGSMIFGTTNNIIDVPNPIDVPDPDDDFDDTLSSTYDFSKLKFQLNGTDVSFPSKIDGILNYVKVDTDKVAAGDFLFLSSDDYTISVSLDNNGSSDVAPEECVVSGVSIYEGSALNFTIDGFAIGDDVSKAAEKYGVKITDDSFGYFNVYDTASSWNTVTFSFSEGKIAGISVAYYD
ncbi:MAG: hypothetical protein K2G62_05035 [Oscillospiraceae bacterium]|nr:hypothetical protein [Oscillospiraceae bacterium]